MTEKPCGCIRGGMMRRICGEHARVMLERRDRLFPRLTSEGTSPQKGADMGSRYGFDTSRRDQQRKQNEADRAAAKQAQPYETRNSVSDRVYAIGRQLTDILEDFSEAHALGLQAVGGPGQLYDVLDIRRTWGLGTSEQYIAGYDSIVYEYRYKYAVKIEVAGEFSSGKISLMMHTYKNNQFQINVPARDWEQLRQVIAKCTGVPVEWEQRTRQ